MSVYIKQEVEVEFQVDDLDGDDAQNVAQDLIDYRNGELATAIEKHMDQALEQVDSQQLLEYVYSRNEEFEAFAEEKGWRLEGAKPEDRLEDLIKNNRDFMLENVYKDFKPAEIFEWLVLFYSSWLRLGADEGGGKEYIAKMCNLRIGEMDEELMWLSLCNNHPNYLATQIGKLVLNGENNGVR